MNLIVGSTGFLGGEICRLLCAQGSAVISTASSTVFRQAGDSIESVDQQGHLKSVREYLQTS
jgi:nucleoside-diphosphate-sugar epimerase